MTQESISKRLAELFELYNSGVINKDEFEQLKSEIIKSGEIHPNEDVKSVIESSQGFKSNDKPKMDNKKSIRNIVIAAISLAIIITAVLFIIQRNSEWDKSRATKKIIAELNSFPDWASKTYRDSSTWYHHIIGFRSMSLDQENVMLAMAISNEEENSINYGWYSVFEFSEKSRWKLKKQSIAFHQGEGIPASLDIIHRISPDNYGVEIEWSEAAMGRRFGISKQIFSFINDEFKMIFHEDRGWYNHSDPIFTLDFVDNGHAYYDIEAMDNDNNRGNGRVKTINYKFNGLEYVSE